MMGAPVTGSGVRAMVATGGGVTLRGLVPGLHSRRLQMIFPLAGPARRGLVSIEAKKRKVPPASLLCAAAQHGSAQLMCCQLLLDVSQSGPACGA